MPAWCMPLTPNGADGSRCTAQPRPWEPTPQHPSPSHPAHHGVSHAPVSCVPAWAAVARSPNRGCLCTTHSTAHNQACAILPPSTWHTTAHENRTHHANMTPARSRHDVPRRAELARVEMYHRTGSTRARVSTSQPVPLCPQPVPRLDAHGTCSGSHRRIRRVPNSDGGEMPVRWESAGSAKAEIDPTGERDRNKDLIDPERSAMRPLVEA